MEFTQTDLDQIKERGVDPNEVSKQINRFKSGFPFAVLDRPATPGDGILCYSHEEIQSLAKIYENKQKGLNPEKFVPASGAASRMFKHLFAAMNGESSNTADEFFANLEKFAFYQELKSRLEDKRHNIGSVGRKTILSTLLEAPMELGAKPKALIPFHKYTETDIRLSLEEHFLEAILHAVGKDKKCLLHFTVSPGHLEAVKSECISLKAKYEKEYRVHFQINFSTQDPHTDTIAVNPDNTPFRTEEGDLLFRPGGHGALLLNLEKTQGDVLFIKNIDNVCKADMQVETKLYKKALAGLLVKVQEIAHGYLKTGETSFLTKLEELGVPLPANSTTGDLKNWLDRPIRVCGMVKNQGEPGGGPFWVKDDTGMCTLQIVEKAQIDVNDKTQNEILSKSTHFNPVDLVCGLRKSDGTLYDLKSFRDDNTGFISDKSLNGKLLKAMELPGLWNGAMANWITLFVEVPLATFNPVKTVNDLAKPSHQPNA